METVGQVNVYFCPACTRPTATVNLADGVTPAFIRCPHCVGDAQSLGYNVRAFLGRSRITNLTVTHAWVRPRPPWSPEWVEHLRKGGLVLVPVRQVLREDDPVTRAGGPGRKNRARQIEELERDAAVPTVPDRQPGRGGPQA